MNREPGSPVDVVDILGRRVRAVEPRTGPRGPGAQRRPPHSDRRLAAPFVEQQAAFGWHRGMLLEGATMQVSFLKDLVTMRDPTSPRSFLNYLQGQGRLADFINNKSLFPSRVEFHDYLEWCAADVRHLVSYGTRAVAVHPVRRARRRRSTEIDVVLRDARATGPRRTGRAHPQPRARHRPRAVAARRASQRGTAVWHNSELLPRASASSRPPVRASGGSSSSARGRARRRRRRTCTTARTRPRCTRCSPATATARPTTPRSPTASSTPRPSTTSSRPGEVKQMLLDYHANTNYSVVDPELIADLYRRAYQEKVRGPAAPARARGLPGVGVRSPTRRRRRRARRVPTARHRGRRRVPAHRPPRDVTTDVVVYATGYRPIDPSGLLGDVGAWCRRAERRRAAGRARLPAAHRRAAHAPASTCRDPPSTPTASARRCCRPPRCGRGRSSTRCSGTAGPAPDLTSPTTTRASRRPSGTRWGDPGGGDAVTGPPWVIAGHRRGPGHRRRGLPAPRRRGRAGRAARPRRRGRRGGSPPTLREHGGTAVAVPADVTDAGAVEKAVDARRGGAGAAGHAGQRRRRAARRPRSPSSTTPTGALPRRQRHRGHARLPRRRRAAGRPRPRVASSPSPPTPPACRAPGWPPTPRRRRPRVAAHPLPGSRAGRAAACAPTSCARARPTPRCSTRWATCPPTTPRSSRGSPETFKRRHPARAGSPTRTTSPRWSRSSPPTPPATSPCRPSTSTAGASLGP